MSNSVRQGMILVALAVAALIAALAGLAPPLAGPAAAADSFGRSLQFTRTGGQTGYVEVADAPDLTPVSSLTIEAWVRPIDTSACQTFIAKDIATSYWFGMCNYGGGRKLQFNSNGSLSGDSGNTVIPNDVWTHVAVTWEAGGQRRYYVNGDLDYAGPARAAPAANGVPVYVGDNPRGGGLPFLGSLAEVRLWSIARGQDDIRRSMHTALQERLPGLVASWNFTDDLQDAIGGHHGTARGGSSPQLTGPAAPPRPAVVPIDTEFLADGSQPSVALYGMAAAAVPGLNRLILAGGLIPIGPRTAQILSLDAGDGRVRVLTGTLPEPVSNATAAYAPSRGLVYVFGGTSVAYDPRATILAVDPTTGASRAVAATLPGPVYSASAAYHAPTGRIVLFGGQNNTSIIFPTPVDSVTIFDPATETAAPAGFRLPAPDTRLTAVASSLTGKIYLFGGQVQTSIIREVTLNPDGVNGGVRELATRLPVSNEGMAGVEDPISGLIYLFGGSNANRVIAFDPVTEQAWETALLLPQTRLAPYAVYDRQNRHALLAGGSDASSPRNTIWRIPLGDGVAVPLGRWDFPAPVTSQVMSIQGDEDGVAVGTLSSGATLYRAK